MSKVKHSVKSNEPFSILAINSSEDDYRLAWLLNESLGIKLARDEHLSPSSEQAFPAFLFSDEVSGLTYALVSNRTVGSYLLPQLKNVDYLLKISGTLTNEFHAVTLSKIRMLPEIVACIAVMPIPSALKTFFNEL